MGRATQLTQKLWEMANLRPKTTGLPMVIWVKPKTTEKHGPRLKVQLSHGSKVKEGEWVSVTIENEPKVIGKGLKDSDFNLVSAFIITNKDGLLKLWKDQIDPVEFAKGIK